MSPSPCYTISCSVLLSLSCLLLSFLPAEPHSRKLETPGVCTSLNIGHEPIAGVNVPDVSIMLENSDSEQLSCYKPDVEYTVVISSSGNWSIKGLLLLQDDDKQFGDFPSKSRLQPGLIKGFCGDRSVSHKCSAGACNLGIRVELPFHSPVSSDADQVVEFRYSIVYSYGLFVENKMAKFEVCKDPICDPEDFQVTEGMEPVYHRGQKRLCSNPTGPPNPRTTTNESRVITENDQNYTCTVIGPEVRKKECATGCSFNGKTLCCRIESIKILNRMFICIPHNDSLQVIMRNFTVQQESRCECFECSDICPKPTMATTLSATSTAKESAATTKSTTTTTHVPESTTSDYSQNDSENIEIDPDPVESNYLY